MLARPKWLPIPLSRVTGLYGATVAVRRFERRLEWLTDAHAYASGRDEMNLPHRVKKHQSVLVRKLGNSDVQLQLNKIENLKLVIDRLDGTMLCPGQTFSFCKLVGKPTRRRGFRLGMELSRGEARPGIGGGICQASNLIFWLVLHSPLEVIERHHHSFDPFPDQGRVLPFASGATVMYNFRDLRFKNNTPHEFQLKLWMDKKCLNGDLRCSVRLPHAYSVYEENHRFEKVDGTYYRDNELWRKVMLKDHGGEIIDREFLFANRAEVKYVPREGNVEYPSK